jgi:serine/threonine-protein phosphatase 2B catalytic subunit
MDIFTWSVPFVSEKVSEMLYFVLDPNKLEDISDDEFDDKNLQKMA